MKRAALIAVIFFVLIATWGIIEFAARRLGYFPVKEPPVSDIHCQPSILALNNTSGFRFRPGTYTCEINGLVSKAVQLGDSSRYTGNETGSKLIHLYGCSVTWGHALDDSSTMAFQLQQMDTAWRVQNYGVGAFSDVQAFMLLQENVANGNKPDLVVLNYGSFHNDRNVLTSLWKKVYSYILEHTAENEALMHIRGIPYVKNEAGSLQTAYLGYSRLIEGDPVRSKFYFEYLVKRMVRNSRDKKKDAEEATYQLLLSIHRWCEDRNIPFVLAGVYNDDLTVKMLDRLDMAGVKTIHLSKGLDGKKYTLEPYDNHPNSLANKIYAERLSVLLQSL